MEHGGRTLGADNSARSVGGAEVVVAGAKVWVVVLSLKLEPGLEDFGGYVYNGSGQVTKETCKRRGENMLASMLLGEFVDEAD